jgi:hypothetical protein
VRLFPRQDARSISCPSTLYSRASDRYCNNNTFIYLTTMRGLGYQLGKVLATAVISLSRISKSTYIGIALAGLLLTFLYSVLPTNNPNNQTSLPPPSKTLHMGATARVTNNSQQVNIRRTSGYLNKSKGDVVVKVPSGEIIKIIGGPEHSDNLTWWNVAWGTYEGWVAEYSSSGRLLLEST